MAEMHPAEEQIGPSYKDALTAIARTIDRAFNGEGDERTVAFVLLMAPFGDGDGRVNYISNADHSDMVTLMREFLARAEGQPEMTGTA